MGNIKYVDQNGLRRAIQNMAAKMQSGLSGKISSIISTDQNNITIDGTDPINPKINLGNSILDKINNIQMQSGIMKYSDFKVVHTSSSLTLADCGSLINIEGGSQITTNLPLSSTVPIGSRIEFLNNSNIISIISSQGSDVLALGSYQNSSMELLPNDTAVFILGRSGNWVLVDGTAQLTYSGSFVATGGTTSYQRIAGGLLIQKGQTNCPRANIWYNFSFPTMFSNAGGVAVAVAPILESGMILDVRVCHATPTNTGVQVACNKAGITLDVIAIGN